MSVRFIGPEQKMGPVAVDDTATIVRNQFVRVVSGEVKAIGAGSNANLAVAMDKYPDTEYEGTKIQVDLALLGEDQEIEVPFVTTDSAGIVQSNVGGGPYALTAAGVVNLEVTSSGVFTVRRLGRETSLGDLTGFVVGVVTDAASF
jgi:hypothetical protein